MKIKVDKPSQRLTRADVSLSQDSWEEIRREDIHVLSRVLLGARREITEAVKRIVDSPFISDFLKMEAVDSLDDILNRGRVRLTPLNREYGFTMELYGVPHAFYTLEGLLTILIVGEKLRTKLQRIMGEIEVMSNIIDKKTEKGRGRLYIQ